MSDRDRPDAGPREASGTPAPPAHHPVRRNHSRAAVAREARRAQMFARFRLTELNLVPLVDTFVSIVFFALTAATVGELTPVVRGVTLPASRVGGTALQQLTVGVGAADITFGARRVMATADAASAPSAAVAGQPAGAMPALYAALRSAADSIRQRQRLAPDAPLETPLAIQGDRVVRYAVLARVMQTARLAGFQQLTLQVERTGGSAP
jgi:biopolymer transport protein ExbD